jgi:hypothetical protein
MVLSPMSIMVDAVPAWNGSPARNRIGRYADREQGPEAGHVVYGDVTLLAGDLRPLLPPSLFLLPFVY